MFNSKICNEEQFSYFKHHVFWPCIRFNTKERLNSAGALSGLSIDVLIESVNKNNYMISSRGLAIMIENETSIFETFASVFTAVGKGENIDIKRVFRK